MVNPYENIYDVDEAVEVIDDNQLTLVQKETKKRQAQSLKNIFVYKMKNNQRVVDLETTKKERLIYIESNELEDTSLYARNFEIAPDRQGLPIFRFKN